MIECILDIEINLLSLQTIKDSFKVKLDEQVDIESCVAEFHWKTKTLVVKLDRI